jgi:large subunit ribosomal protein L24e
MTLYLVSGQANLQVFEKKFSRHGVAAGLAGSKSLFFIGLKQIGPSTMVVKTDLCAFSEFRIYPGHGIKFVRRDGQPVNLGSTKVRSLLTKSGKKSNKLQWTQAWRKLNKKGNEASATRKKQRKTVRIVRGIAGMSADAFKAKRKPVTAKPKKSNAATDAALKEVKGRKTNTGGGKGNVTQGGGGNASVPKLQKKHN